MTTKKYKITVTVANGEELHEGQALATVNNIPGVGCAVVKPCCPVCGDTFEDATSVNRRKYEVDVEDYDNICFHEDSLEVYLH
ncbi:hypothetical protein [Halocatena halophila]|uniref:hypothetical protein n=1 Tax=Halocatena halophila TaxID=2814576 RepID=UPI002ED2DA65